MLYLGCIPHKNSQRQNFQGVFNPDQRFPLSTLYNHHCTIFLSVTAVWAADLEAAKPLRLLGIHF